MAQAPSPATKSADLPTIIIDPLLYEPERPAPSQTVYDSFIRLTRVTVAVTAVSTATFGIAQVLPLDSLLSSKPVSALTEALSGLAKQEPKERAARTPERVALPARVEHDSLPAGPTPSAVILARDSARLDAAPNLLQARPDEGAAPDEGARSSDAADELDTASGVQSATSVVPRAVSQARGAPSSALPKADTQAATVQDEVRNARRLLAMNRLEQAEAAYRKALATNASEPAALTGLARVQLARGQVDDALASALRAVEMAPAAASAHLALGDVLRSRGDKSAAELHYSQAAQLK